MPVPDEASPVAPRAVAPLPPAWGMGDRRPGDGGVPVDGSRRGGGAPRPVGFRASGLDAAILVAVLLIWTALFVLFFAQR
ncbi:MAG: hypothetical protein ABR977_00150 [Candidatus Dormibacteria bacterium]|jgi:hypothetical protein